MAAFLWFIVKLIIYMVISYAIAYLMQDDGPDTPGAKPGQFEAPVVTASDSIPVLFGERILKSPNVVWYGHISSTPYFR